MKTEVVTITPSKAKKWLEAAATFQNRHVSKRHVDFLASQMLSGEWKLNGETIKFNNGTVIDGQHRLMACLQAGVPFSSYVVYDMPQDVFTTIDTGRRRAQADALSMLGNPNAARLSSALIWLHRLKTGQMGRRPIISNTEIVRLRDEYSAIELGGTFGERVKKFLAPAATMALYYLFAEKDKDAADAFFEKLATGAELTKTNPILRLRENLANKEKGSQRMTGERMALVIKAWNMVRNKKPASIQSLAFRKDEAFPKIV